METASKIGGDLRADDPDARTLAARLMGSVTSERKKASGAVNARKAAEAARLAAANRTAEEAEEIRRKRSEAQKARRAMEAAQRGSLESSTAPRRGRGRPPKAQELVQEPKRGRGRPKKLGASEQPQEA
jgi:hypothetical protein